MSHSATIACMLGLLLLIGSSARGQAPTIEIRQAPTQLMSGPVAVAKASFMHPAPVTTASSRSSALSREISLNLEEVSLERALKEIAAKAGVDIVYLRETVAAADKTISLNLEAVPVGEALRSEEAHV